MKTVALTGGTGSGKSAISAMLSEKGLYVIDCDKIGHEVILRGNAAYDELVSYFSEKILDENGEIVRRRLGDIVFADKEKLAFLNSCTHKHINKEVIDRIKFANSLPDKYKAVAIDVPLLKEGGIRKLCNEVWLVFADEKSRIQRIMARDNITHEQALARVKNQQSFEEYKKLADFIIDNSRDLTHADRQVNKLIANLLLYGENNV